ncbi:MAG: 2-C-methyl-D-erythritol 2,4-cyclodiphosphate synthase [Candidatus Omnitrophota bacterium]
MRIGFGYDIHRVREGGVMFLGGVEVSRERGLLGHSDGDVLLHAVTDAVLGALSKGDIGGLFPDTDESIRGISSVKILEEAAGIMRREGFKLGNLDCVVVAETPKIGRYREKIARLISSALFSEPGNISVKGKTKEGMGEVGSGGAIEAYAVVMLVETH